MHLPNDLGKPNALCSVSRLHPVSWKPVLMREQKQKGVCSFDQPGLLHCRNREFSTRNPPRPLDHEAFSATLPSRHKRTQREGERENLERRELSGRSGLLEELGGGMEQIGPAAHVSLVRHRFALLCFLSSSLLLSELKLNLRKRGKGYRREQSVREEGGNKGEKVGWLIKWWMLVKWHTQMQVLTWWLTRYCFILLLVLVYFVFNDHFRGLLMPYYQQDKMK